MSERTIPIIWIEDQDSYASLWVDGDVNMHSSDNMRVEDALRLVAELANKNPGVPIDVKTFNLYECSTSDIPTALTTFDAINEWHKNQYGVGLSDGW